MNWIIYASFAVLLTSFSDLLKKRILNREHTFEFLTVFTATNIIVLFPFIHFVNFHLPKLIWGAIAFRAVIIFLSVTFLMKAFRHLPLSVASPLTNLKSIFALVLGVLFLHESANALQFTGIFVVVLGAYLLDSEGRNWQKPFKDMFHSKYVQFVLLFAFFTALSSVLAKAILEFTTPLTLLFLIVLFLFFIYLSITFLVYGGISDIKDALKKGRFWFFIISALEMSSAFFFFNAFTANAKVILLVPFMQLSTLIEIFLGGKILHEKHIRIKLLAGALMISGVFLIIL